MRCPKCQYISFDSGDRCRNCGYDFSLNDAPETQDLAIKNGTEPIGPLADFALQTPRDRLADGFSTEDPEARLPLFTDQSSSDAPLVTPSATPRAPLAVRRATIAPPKPRPRRDGAPAAQSVEPRLALETAEIPIVRERKPPPSVPARASEAVLAAPIFRRLAGGLIDLSIIAGIDFGVLYFTLEICGLTFAQITMLPLAPLVAFLLLLNGGYLAAFVAAGGQTIGKMATGLRVIPGDPGAHVAERVPFGHAIVRAAAYFVSALPAGLGFVPALFGAERRALHDRLADTRVVKA
jgi:uncharacterized RDD family membrane protein YckC